MKIISWEEFTAPSFKITKPASITVGVFDGVHRGHNYLINKLKDVNLEERIVFTFLHNPVLYIKYKRFLGNIYTLNQKLQALDKAGVTTAVLIDFSSDFSKLKGEFFISTILEHINMKRIVLGKDFKCGINNSTTSFDIFNLLKDKDIETIIVNRQNFKNIPVSSSDIRKMIISGNIELASELLPYGYSVDLLETEIIMNSDSSYVYRDKIDQLLPESGRFLLDLEIKNITSKKEVFIDNRIIKWFNK